MTQLRIILQNVIEAWKAASTTMDNLMSGIAQEVHDGEHLIGIHAWHLYPDMIVFGGRNVEVKMNDDLIRRGGILTLRCSPSATTLKSGIIWSLSLGSLKFYGELVAATAKIQEGLSRLTVKEFRLALLGCVLRAWNIAPTGQ